MAERADIQPTNHAAATTPAINETAATTPTTNDTAATAPAINEAVAIPPTAETSAAPAVTITEIIAAPTLIPNEAPPVEIARTPADIGRTDSAPSKSPVPEIKLPPAAELAAPKPSRSRFGRVFSRREAPPPAPPRPAAPPKPAQPRPAPPKPLPAKPAPAKSRFPLLAASLALAAAIGGAAGSVGVPALVQYAFAPPPPAVTPAQESAAEIAAIRGLAAQLASDLGAFRTTAELSSRTTSAQYAKLTERLDRAERAQADARIAKISEAVDRLERRAAAPDHGDVTGSIAKPTAPAPAPAPVVAAAQPQPEKAEAKPKPTIIEDYVLRRVFDGVALVEGRRGIIEVAPGFNLPGAGRVEEIRRQDGRWVVVTNKGLIVPVR